MDMNIEGSAKSARVTLRTVADYTGLTPGTISAVLNNTPGARRIPQPTRDRILAAARELKYQPNPLARALRTGQVMATSTDGQEFGNTRRSEERRVGKEQ